MEHLDKVDQKIIEMLTKNARLPSREIAAELKKNGLDMHDRNVRKRIERLEKSGVIKGYKAILAPVQIAREYKTLLIRFKPSRTLSALKKSISQFSKDDPSNLLVADLSPDWDTLVLAEVGDNGEAYLQKIIEKFADDISKFEIVRTDIISSNLVNFGLILMKS